MIYSSLLAVKKFHFACRSVDRHELRLWAILNHFIGLFDLGDHLADTLIPVNYACLGLVLHTYVITTPRHLLLCIDWVADTAKHLPIVECVLSLQNMLALDSPQHWWGSIALNDHKFLPELVATALAQEHLWRCGWWVFLPPHHMVLTR